MIRHDAALHSCHDVDGGIKAGTALATTTAENIKHGLSLMAIYGGDFAA